MNTQGVTFTSNNNIRKNSTTAQAIALASGGSIFSQYNNTNGVIKNYQRQRASSANQAGRKANPGATFPSISNNGPGSQTIAGYDPASFLGISSNNGGGRYGPGYSTNNNTNNTSTSGHRSSYGRQQGNVTAQMLSNSNSENDLPPRRVQSANISNRSRGHDYPIGYTAMRQSINNSYNNNTTNNNLQQNSNKLGSNPLLKPSTNTNNNTNSNNNEGNSNKGSSAVGGWYGSSTNNTNASMYASLYNKTPLANNPILSPQEATAGKVRIIKVKDTGMSLTSILKVNTKPNNTTTPYHLTRLGNKRPTARHQNTNNNSNSGGKKVCFSPQLINFRPLEDPFIPVPKNTSLKVVPTTTLNTNTNKVTINPRETLAPSASSQSLNSAISDLSTEDITTNNNNSANNMKGNVISNVRPSSPLVLPSNTYNDSNSTVANNNNTVTRVFAGAIDPSTVHTIVSNVAAGGNASHNSSSSTFHSMSSGSTGYFSPAGSQYSITINDRSPRKSDNSNNSTPTTAPAEKHMPPITNNSNGTTNANNKKLSPREVFNVGDKVFTAHDPSIRFPFSNNINSNNSSSNGKQSIISDNIISKHYGSNINSNSPRRDNNDLLFKKIDTITIEEVEDNSTTTNISNTTATNNTVPKHHNNGKPPLFGHNHDISNKHTNTDTSDNCNNRRNSNDKLPNLPSGVSMMRPKSTTTTTENTTTPVGSLFTNYKNNNNDTNNNGNTSDTASVDSTSNSIETLTNDNNIITSTSTATSIDIGIASPNNNSSGNKSPTNSKKKKKKIQRPSLSQQFASIGDKAQIITSELRTRNKRPESPPPAPLDGSPIPTRGLITISSNSDSSK